MLKTSLDTEDHTKVSEGHLSIIMSVTLFISFHKNHMELSVASTFTFQLNALEPSAHLKLPLPKDFLGNGLITNKLEYVENVFQIVIPAC